MQSILVTIGIPNYNSGIFLKEACQSVINQTYSNFEVIVTDDCSTDQSFTIASEAISDDRFLFLPSEINRGPQVQRNEQLRRAKGKYFFVLDADDIWHPDKIQLQVEYMERYDEIFALGTAINIGEVPFATSNPIARKSTANEILKTHLFWETPIWNTTLMFRTETAQRLNLKWDRDEWAEDQTFLLSAARKNLRFSNLQENLTFYRRHGNQMTDQGVRLASSAFRIRMNHGDHYFNGFKQAEWKLLLLNPTHHAALWDAYTSKDHCLKIQAFRKLRKACAQTNCIFPHAAVLKERCENTILLLIRNPILSEWQKTHATLHNSDVIVRLLVRKIMRIIKN